MNDTQEYDEQKAALIKTGQIQYAQGTVPYKPYGEWVYYPAGNPPTESESQRCAASINGRTSGPYALPDGAQVCFVSDKCSGPFQGSFQYAFSKDGTELEMAVPFAAFLKLASSGQVGFPFFFFKFFFSFLYD